MKNKIIKRFNLIDIKVSKTSAKPSILYNLKKSKLKLNPHT